MWNLSYLGSTVAARASSVVLGVGYVLLPVWDRGPWTVHLCRLSESLGSPLNYILCYPYHIIPSQTLVIMIVGFVFVLTSDLTDHKASIALDVRVSVISKHDVSVDILPYT